MERYRNTERGKPENVVLEKEGALITERMKLCTQSRKDAEVVEDLEPPEEGSQR